MTDKFKKLMEQLPYNFKSFLEFDIVSILEYDLLSMNSVQLEIESYNN